MENESLENGTYQLTAKQLEELMNLAGKAAAKQCLVEIEKKQIKMKKDAEKQRYNKTKDMLKSYRREKIKLEDEARFTEEEQASMRWEFLVDLIGNPDQSVSKAERVVDDFESKRRDTKYAIWSIDNAIRLYEQEVELSGNDVDKRRFAELMAMYIDDDAMDVHELAEYYQVTEKAIYKDIGIATRIMTVYLFGAV